MAPKLALLAALLALVATSFTRATNSITLYRDINFLGDSVEIGTEEPSFPPDFNDQTSSAIVKGVPWILYTDINFQGEVSILEPGTYPTPADLRLPNDRISSARPFPPPSPVSIMIFEDIDFKGAALRLTGPTSNFVHVFLDFNDKGSSAIVLSGTWRLYKDIDFGGESFDLSPGRYPRAGPGNDGLSSCRPI